MKIVTKQIEYDPLAPIQFLIIFGEEDFVQFNYPEDFLDEKSIKELILPRTSEEIKKVVSQSRLTCINGGIRFGHNKPEGIEQAIKFNGRSARCGLPLEVFREKVRMRMYNEGLNDTEIGKKLRLTISAIWHWREKRGLKPNFSRKLNKNEEELRMKLYKEGLNDTEIGKKLGLNKSAIWSWRKKEGLKSNFSRRLSEDEEELRMKLYKEGLTDGEIGKKIGRGFATIQAWRKRKGLPTTYVRGSKYSDKEKAVLSYLEKHGPTTHKELITNTIITATDTSKLLRTLFDKIECMWFKFGTSNKIKARDLLGDLTNSRIFALRDDPRTLDYIRKNTIKTLRFRPIYKNLHSTKIWKYFRQRTSTRVSEKSKRVQRNE